LDGAKSITVSLLDAEDEVDSGAIWAKREISVPLGALYDEINKALFETEISLMSEAVARINDETAPVPQDATVEPTFHRKRTPADSEIDPSLSLEALFNKIRLMDPERYPAYFYLHGQKYTIELRKVSSDDKFHD
jgi:methionyl-tRNA formyltransferase